MDGSCVVAQRGPALSRATVATSSRIVRVSQEDERPTTRDRCVYKQARRAAQGADNPLRDPTTGCWVPLRRLKRGPMELSAPSRYATKQRALLDTWKRRPGMKGLRFYFSDPQSLTWPDDGNLDWVFPVAERLGIPVSLQASAFLPRVGAIAERHPGLRLSVDHLGVPRATVGAEGAYRHLDQLVALAKYPNVAVKATGQAGYATDAYPFSSIHDALHRVFDAFGPRRMFWGTDITRMHCTWRQCVTLFTKELRWLKGADLALVMGRAWCDWIGWDVGAAEAAERAQAHAL